MPKSNWKRCCYAILKMIRKVIIVLGIKWFLIDLYGIKSYFWQRQSLYIGCEKVIRYFDQNLSYMSSISVYL